MAMVWHYAPWAYLPAMVEYGALKGSNAGAQNEVAMLWFSANQQWEPTATKLISVAGGWVQMSFEQQAQRFGCVRFGMAADDFRLLDWASACKVAGTQREHRRALERAGKKQGAKPAHWFATIADVPLSELHFQVWANRWCNATSLQDMSESWTASRNS
jgi:hypothetical protein